MEQAKALTGLKKKLGTPREKLLATRAGPTTESSWTSIAKGAAGKAARAVASLGEDGLWRDSGELDARDFVEHFNAMTAYVEGARKGGETFAKLRAE